MDILGIMRALGSLTVILGMLAGALWAVRRFDIRLPGRTGGSNDRRLQMVERLGLDQRRSVVLIRRDQREHLVMLSPEGNVTIESFDSPAAETAVAGGTAGAGRQTLRTSPRFAELLDDDVVGDDVIDWGVAKRSCAKATRRKH